MPVVGGSTDPLNVGSDAAERKPVEGHRLSLRASQVHAYLRAWGDRNEGRINPKREQMAAELGCDVRTIQRALRELEAAGVLVRLYNGGRGRRVLCFLGKAATDRARNAPEWERTHKRGEAEVRTYGAMRMGRVAQRRRGLDDAGERPKMGDQNARDTGPATSYKKIPDRDPKVSAAQTVPANSHCPDQAASPPTPPSGGPAPSSLARCPVPEHKASSAPKLPASESARTPSPSTETHEPPGPPARAARPPRGPETKRHPGASSGPKSSLAPIDPRVWDICWAIWREEHKRRFGRGPVPDGACDRKAMIGLCRTSIREGGGVLDVALNFFAWGVVRYLRDARWSGQVRMLRRLWSLRVEYGHPPIGWKRPWAREQAENAAAENGSTGAGGLGKNSEQLELDSLPKNHSVGSSSPSSSTGDPSHKPSSGLAGSPVTSSDPSPSKGLSRLEMARRALALVENAVAAGVLDKRRLASARAEVDALAAKAADGSGTAEETK